jgi:hypothetical protein
MMVRMARDATLNYFERPASVEPGAKRDVRAPGIGNPLRRRCWHSALVALRSPRDGLTRALITV